MAARDFAYYRYTHNDGRNFRVRMLRRIGDDPDLGFSADNPADPFPPQGSRLRTGNFEATDGSGRRVRIRIGSPTAPVIVNPAARVNFQLKSTGGTWEALCTGIDEGYIPKGRITVAPAP